MLVPIPASRRTLPRGRLCQILLQTRVEKRVRTFEKACPAFCPFDMLEELHERLLVAMLQSPALDCSVDGPACEADRYRRWKEHLQRHHCFIQGIASCGSFSRSCGRRHIDGNGHVDEKQSSEPAARDSLYRVDLRGDVRMLSAIKVEMPSDRNAARRIAIDSS